MADGGSVPFDLERLAEARALCDWMYEQFAGSARGTVVEVGPGIGTFSERLLRSGVERLVLVEPDPACARVLRERFRDDGRTRILEEELPGAPSLRELVGEADFVLCQNVLEHIPDDAAALRAMAELLQPGGELGLLVPAHPRLFGALDRRYGHERRYTRDRLAQLIRGAGLEPRALYSFNLLGVPGWWLANRRARPALTARGLRSFDLALRAWRPFERIRHPPAGLSLVARAARP